MRLLETRAKACGGSAATTRAGLMKTVRWISCSALLSGSLLGLASCATKPDQEGLIGPDVSNDPVEIRRDQHSYQQDDPSEVKVDLLKYKKKF